ncbi:hypothetical protein Cfor_08503 [Coptotermes formosanus]|uniref:Uncharacterized protein n=1 Tax=Coptotermes formosanus TaxID=36987 RepID=A0A6L2PQX3_COPFO|nr:hypothetical protein Cfor_08503 [Coptotermes formosanus]
MEIRPHSRPERHSNEVLVDVGSDINTLTETFVRNQAEKEWRGPKFPNYATYKQRLHSFANWPRNTSPSREELSAAGFYYTGKWDVTRCFHCGGTLEHWETEDDPWTEHSYWFPYSVSTIYERRRICYKKPRITFSTYAWK